MKKLVLLFCSLLAWSGAFSQNQNDDCKKKLEKVIEAYQQGTIDLIATENPLPDCMGYFGQEDKIRAHKYLVLIYLYINENAAAKSEMQAFMKAQLKSNPEYDPRQSEPEKGIPEFLELYNQLRSWPTYYYGLRLGANLGQVETTKNFSLDRSNVLRGDYQAELGYQIGISFEFPFGGARQSFSFVPELYYERLRYLFTDVVLDFADLSFTEKQSRIMMPFLLKYHFKRAPRLSQNEETAKPVRNKIQPFIQAGAALSFTFQAQADLERVDVLPQLGGDGGGSRDPITGTADLLNDKQRQALNYGLLLGGGLRFRNFLKTGGDLSLETRFFWALNNQVQAAQRGDNLDLIYRFGYIDSDFKLHTLSISLGYLLPKYNPQPVLRGKQPYQTEFGKSDKKKKKE
ncbi:MAG: PorT family protein [Microscillaceae bacterium]|nr:PorT family protein [Microscillaceae bacterium]